MITMVYMDTVALQLEYTASKHGDCQCHAWRSAKVKSLQITLLCAGLYKD
jgi:hypothetical protein